jgi:hypothetical protein
MLHASELFSRRATLKTWSEAEKQLLLRTRKGFSTTYSNSLQVSNKEKEAFTASPTHAFPFYFNER